MSKNKCFLILIFLFSYISVFAAPPSNIQGKLIFLGVNHDASQSVWLSVTSAAGSFQLRAQGQQLIDAWDRSRAGLRLSLSPIVSNGNGGTHHLINAANNKKLDSQNQHGGVVFPPFPTLPPPSVSHPIVNVPAHPIVIPPEPSKPTPPPHPSHPIVNVPTHPIVLPPPSSTPPPHVSHPIVETPAHPIVLPPESPSIPGTPEHPIVIPPGSSSEGNQPIAGRPSHPTDTPSTSPSWQQGQVVTTVSTTNEQTATDTFDQEAPITAARAFNEEQQWNVWSDNYYYGSRDSQLNLDAKGTTTDFILGADRHITNNLVGGAMISSSNYNTTAFGGLLDNNVKGFNVGPYFGYLISPHWSTDGSVTYGQLRNKNKIASLNSHYVTQEVTGTMHVTGLFQLGNFQLKPQPLVSYTHFQNPTYQLSGNILNFPVDVTREKESFNFGYTELKIEGNYTIERKNGDLIQPYTEIGGDYIFVRPSDGQIYSGNLALASFSPFSGFLTLGARALIANKFMIQTSGSYLSFNQNSLDVWEVRLMGSYSFS